MNEKVQIIGGSGFVGSRLISQLNPNFCNNLDKKQSPFFKSITKIGDIRNIDEIIFSKNTETVVLLAAEHRDDVSPISLYYDVNVQGTINVLKKMDLLGIKKLIFTSSVAVYGLDKKNPDENHQVDPFNHYGKSKYNAELEIQKWYKKDPKNKSATIIRPTVIFGERNRGNVFNLLKQIVSKRFLMIGSGQNKKSMAYVGNVISFIENRIKKGELGLNIYNYVDKPDYSLNELVSHIDKIMNIKSNKIKIPYKFGLLSSYIFDLISIITGKKLSVSSVRIKKFCATTQFCSKKTNSIFKAPFSLSEGLKNTIEYEFKNLKKDDIIFYSE